MDKYYIVDRSILPDVVEKVIEARALLENGEVHQVSEAVKRVASAAGRITNTRTWSSAPHRSCRTVKPSCR